MLHTSTKRPAQSRGCQRGAHYSHHAKNDRVSSWPGSPRAGPDLLGLARIDLDRPTLTWTDRPESKARDPIAFSALSAIEHLPFIH